MGMKNLTSRDTFLRPWDSQPWCSFCGGRSEETRSTRLSATLPKATSKRQLPLGRVYFLTRRYLLACNTVPPFDISNFPFSSNRNHTPPMDPTSAVLMHLCHLSTSTWFSLGPFEVKTDIMKIERAYVGMKNATKLCCLPKEDVFVTPDLQS